ncbi:MAG: hypothetical protein HQK54_10575 [Oligoflexales bacterium]|nr:hypothetical protein [Oligoflexales bacterium]
MQRVVISGLGVVSPIGIGKDDFWSALSRHRGTPLREVKTAGGARGGIPSIEIDDFDYGKLSRFGDDKRTKYMDRYIQYAAMAMELALDDAGLVKNGLDLSDCGIIFGSAYGCIENNTRHIEGLYNKGPRFVNPVIYQNTVPNTAPGYCALLFGMRGYNTIITSGMTSGLNAISYAYNLIKIGRADLIVAGGVERWCDALQRSLELSGLVSSRSEASQGSAAKPNNMFVSEGAGVIVLESMAHAQKRNARIYAEMCGYGMANNLDTSRGISDCIRQALSENRMTPGDVGSTYICAHANSEGAPEKEELKAISSVFGNNGPSICVGTIKGSLGEALGAAGGFGIAASAMALDKGEIPPTCNLKFSDDESNFHFIYNNTEIRKIDHAIVNSIGIDGNNMSILLKKA